MIAGLVAIVAGGALLAWPSRTAAPASIIGSALVAAACLAWAFDNNLTRKVSGADARIIAAVKGLAAGCANTALAFALGNKLPGASHLAAILLLGFVGYGLSLVLFVIALRHLGSARTGAYFATAPFVGTAIAIALFGQPVTALFWAAAALMAIGVWLHLSERHEHHHEPLLHRHPHFPDLHHRHRHG